jgi:hypothetical protein
MGVLLLKLVALVIGLAATVLLVWESEGRR